MQPRVLRPNTLDSLVTAKMAADVYHAREYVDGNGWVLDIGANIGAFCLHVKSFCPQVQILCVEPMPSNLETLRSNVEGHAIVIPAALVGSAGSVTMYDFGPSYSGCHSMYHLNVPGSIPVQVTGVTLAQLLSMHNISLVQFLKLDCQGAEYDVIPSLDETTLDRIDFIALEVHYRIAAGDTFLGEIPDQRTKAKAMFSKLQQTHRLIHGRLEDSDIEQVWQNKRLS